MEDAFVTIDEWLAKQRTPERARRVLEQALDHRLVAEAKVYVDARPGRDDVGALRVMWNGRSPVREVRTPIGPVTVRRPRLLENGKEVGALTDWLERYRRRYDWEWVARVLGLEFQPVEEE